MDIKDLVQKYNLTVGLTASDLDDLITTDKHYTVKDVVSELTTLLTLNNMDKKASVINFMLEFIEKEMWK